MKWGIFAKTFSRPDLASVLDAVVGHGLQELQFNLACCGLPTLPETLPQTLVRQIRQAMDSRGLRLAALSATFNLIDPDHARRDEGLRRLSLLAEAAPDLGTRVLTLCTGTRDPADMWKAHPDNDSAAAWDDLCRSMDTALEAAARNRVVLGVEPELANVVDSAVRARRLLDTFRSPCLKIVIDPANLFPSGTLPQMSRVLNEAFDLLGRDLVLAHAKDLKRDGEAGHAAAGTGVLDYDLYLRRLRDSGFEGPVILHGLVESEVPAAIRFLQDRWELASCA